MKEEIIIINGEPFYRIPNGTSCDYAPIPKQFKPYFEKLEEENKSLQSQLKEKEEENEQLKADYGNLAQVERDFLKEVIKEAREYIDTKVISNGEIIDQLRKIEIKKLLEILSKGENK